MSGELSNDEGERLEHFSTISEIFNRLIYVAFGTGIGGVLVMIYLTGKL